MLTDMAHDFVQILGAGENSARDHISLDLGEASLHLVEPGQVGRAGQWHDRIRFRHLAIRPYKDYIKSL